MQNKAPDYSNVFDLNTAAKYIDEPKQVAPNRDAVEGELQAKTEQFLCWLYDELILEKNQAFIGNAQGDKGQSLCIETKGPSRGLWYDFATGKGGGDFIGLYMAAKDIPNKEFHRALKELAQWAGMATTTNYEAKYVRRMLKATNRKTVEIGPAKGTWTYHDPEGNPIAEISRHEYTDQNGTVKKEFRPYTFNDTGGGNYRMPKPRHIYNAHLVNNAKPIVFCEGEKTADAITNAGFVGTTLMGGAMAVNQADYSSLKGHQVILWRDNDDAGKKWETRLKAKLMSEGALVSGSVQIPNDKAIKWDAADTTPEEIQKLIKEAKNHPIKGPLKSLPWNAITMPKESVYLIKKLIDAGCMSLVFGRSGTGKTFFILDLAIHVALNRGWNGRRVKWGGVLYIAAEGGPGMRKRIEAIRHQHDLSLQDDVPFALLPTSLSLTESDDDTLKLIEEIKVVSKGMDTPIKLVVIDTLSRCFSGGNENGSEDMTAFIANVDTIRETTGAHVLVVHHSGKEEARGARGHSSLRAATDTEIELKKDGENIIATVTKQKDGEEGEKFAFRLLTQKLGIDDDGDEISTCTVEYIEDYKKAPTLKPTGKTALIALKEGLANNGEYLQGHETEEKGLKVLPLKSWRKLAMDNGISTSDNTETIKRQMKRGLDNLADHGIAKEDGEYIWLTRQDGH